MSTHHPDWTGYIIQGRLAGREFDPEDDGWNDWYWPVGLFNMEDRWAEVDDRIHAYPTFEFRLIFRTTDVEITR